MPPITLTFQFETETKGAVRYIELDHHGAPIKRTTEAIVGRLYLRKTTFQGNWPAALRVTIELV